MILPFTFLVGTGALSGEMMSSGSLTLSRFWGGALLKSSTSSSPLSVLETLPQGNGLVQLVGDPAIYVPNYGSWLEVLGAWKIPTILIAAPMVSGEIPGAVAAYVSLCSSLSVPLLGTLQLGGVWDADSRRNDGLPWCGWIAGEESVESAKLETDVNEGYMHPLEVVSNLRRQFLSINS